MAGVKTRNVLSTRDSEGEMKIIRDGLSEDDG